MSRLVTITFAALLALGTAGVADAAGKGKAASTRRAEDRIAAQVRASLPHDLILDEVHLPRGFTIPKGGTLSVTWRKEPAAGAAFVLATVTQGRKVSRRAFVRVELVPIREVLVTQRPLTKGDVLRAGDLSFEPRIGQIGVDLEPEALLGSPVLADMAAGDTVTPETIGLPPPVSRGSSIQVVAHYGKVRVVAQARLEQTARPGERTSARVVATRSVVRGRLVDPHTLVIDEAAP